MVQKFTRMNDETQRHAGIGMKRRSNEVDRQKYSPDVPGKIAIEVYESGIIVSFVCSADAVIASYKRVF